MNSHQHSSSVLLILSLLLVSNSSYAEDKGQAILTVKGVVSKGSCSFLLTDQTVKFPQTLLTQDIGEIGAVPENIVSFATSYACQDYDEDETPDMSIIIKAATGSQINNNKIYPTNNVTNAAFVLYDCDDFGDCSMTHFIAGSGYTFFKTDNGNKDRNFLVEIVKLNNSPVKDGNLQATVTFTLAQP